MRTKTQKWLECGNGTLNHPLGGSITTDVVELDDFGRIFEVYHYSNEPEQNHRLILAAPMLLEALQDAVVLVSHMANSQRRTSVDIAQAQACLPQIYAALASATGQKP